MGEKASETLARLSDTQARRRELVTFLLLAIVIWPFIAIGVVAGWGFIVWMYYVLTGPPGPG
jgi:nitrate reductase NapE